MGVVALTSPSVADQLHGAHRNAHLQVSEPRGLLGTLPRDGMEWDGAGCGHHSRHKCCAGWPCSTLIHCLSLSTAVSCLPPKWAICFILGPFMERDGQALLELPNLARHALVEVLPVVQP